MKRRLERIKGRIMPVLERYDVKRAAIVGSFARGETKRDSDIDVIVEFEKERSLLDLVSLKLELEKQLGREVDILTYNALHPSLRKAILEEQVVIL